MTSVTHGYHTMTSTRVWDVCTAGGFAFLSSAALSPPSRIAMAGRRLVRGRWRPPNTCRQQAVV